MGEQGPLSFGVEPSKLQEYTILVLKGLLQRARWRLPANWFYERGPSRPLPSLPVSWPFFVGVSILIDGLWIWGYVPSSLPFIIRILLVTLVPLFLLKGALHMQKLDFHALGLSREGLTQEVAVGLSLSAIIILAAIVNNTLAGSPPRLMFATSNDSLWNWLSRLAIWGAELALKAVAVGIVEEVIHRGWMLTFLLSRLASRECACWISAIIFGLGHFEQGIQAIALTTVFGYVYGLLYMWRKALTVPIVVHTLWNFSVWLGLLGGNAQ